MDDASAFLKSILHEDAEDLTSWACLAAVRAYEEARETRRPGSPWMPMQRLWLEDLAVAWALAAVESLDKPAGIG